MPFPGSLEHADIKGFLHCHTKYSDGSNSVLELAEACRAAGYEYIGITDHSQAAAYAGGLKADDLARQADEIDEANTKVAGIRILKGVEADILQDGRIDFDESVLARLDFVIASIHSRFNMSEREMTTRMLAAMDNPHLTIIGHPTGRLLLSRDPYGLDIDAVMEKAAAAGVTLEVNADPHRLDLDWQSVRRAHERGVDDFHRGRRAQRGGNRKRRIRCWHGEEGLDRSRGGSQRATGRPFPGTCGPEARGLRRAPRKSATELRARRAKLTFRRLSRAYPDAKTALNHRNAFELLCATILSAQCTDARVNLVTPHLFARFPTPEALAGASRKEVEEIIKSTGFFRNKSKSLVGMAQALVADHGSEVPRSMAELRTLPGVGRKTANVDPGKCLWHQ